MPRPPSVTPARGLLPLALILSLVAHLGLTPVASLVGLLSWLRPPSRATPTESLEPIEIDLSWLEAGPSQPVAEPPSASAEASDSAALLPDGPQSPPAAPRAPEVPDAGRDEQMAKQERKTSRPPKSQPKAEAKRDEARRRPSEDAHPVELAGVSSKAIPREANVNLLVSLSRVRNHPLGARIGKLVSNMPQWRSFLASESVDPVRDLDRILMVGPQFRRSDHVVAVVVHRLGLKRARSAVDALVKRPPKGRWLSRKPLMALAHADRAERLLMLPGPRVLVVAPPVMQQKLLESPVGEFPEPPEGIALVLYVHEPRRALLGLPLALPQSLAWIRLEAEPTADGGALVEVQAMDESPKAARRHARELTIAINAATHPDLGALGALLGVRSLALLDETQLAARGKRIIGELKVRPSQLARLLSYAEGWFAPRVRPGPGAPRKGRPPRSLPAPPAPRNEPGSPPRAGDDRGQKLAPRGRDG